MQLMERDLISTLAFILYVGPLCSAGVRFAVEGRLVSVFTKTPTQSIKYHFFPYPVSQLMTRTDPLYLCVCIIRDANGKN